MAFIPYGKQSIGKEDIDAVVEVLQSSYLTTGPKVGEFEEAICAYTGATYAVAVANGTAALHLASLVLLEEGDKVLTTPNSFLATSNALLYVGAKPVFVDIAPDGNIDLELCEQYLKEDPSIKGIYAVHFSGNPVNQERLRTLREKCGVIILEDCAHSIGAEYNGVKAGSCTHSDCSILSFHPVKHLTTGEGGAITTNSEVLYHKLLKLRMHGMERQTENFTNRDMAFDEKGNINPWYYEMDSLGFNYRITDFQCALGLSQFKKLDGFIARRRKLAQAYDAAFCGASPIQPLYRFDGNSSYHLYVVQADFARLNITRAELFKRMQEKEIGLQLHYIPINKQPYYTARGYGDEATPNMDHYYASCFSLPMYPSLSDAEQEYVISTLNDIFDKSTR